MEKNIKKTKETKEATGAASAGSYAPKLEMWSDDETAKSEYKKKKNVSGEFKEATYSVGAYDAPGFEDVNMRGNNLVGSGRSFKTPQIKGGDFVVIDRKCKTFPYCSQGDSKDKPVKTKKSLSKTKKNKSPLSEAIENVSAKTGLSTQEIKNIILSKINDNL
jgi:hypothetical protein